jgi:hypothetical protein
MLIIVVIIKKINFKIEHDKQTKKKKKNLNQNKIE